MKLLIPAYFLMATSIQMRETELVWKMMWQEQTQPVVTEKVVIEEFGFDADKVEFKAKLKKD